MGYDIDKRHLRYLALDSKLDLGELPAKLVPEKPYTLFGRSGSVYNLLVGKDLLLVNDPNSLAILSAKFESALLSFEVITRPSLEEARYNEDFDAKLFIGAAIYYLEKMGNRIATWESVWNGGVNFAQYKQNLKNSRESHEFAWSEAAWNTWTGQQALLHGFDTVEAKSRKDIDASKYIFHFKR